jgi:hypothetical protein
MMERKSTTDGQPNQPQATGHRPQATGHKTDKPTDTSPKPPSQPNGHTPNSINTNNNDAHQQLR